MGELQDLSEINPHLALAAWESFVSDDERRFGAWSRKAEKLLGHSIDGNQGADGYSLDEAGDLFDAGYSVEKYVAEVRINIAALDAAFGPRIFPSAIGQYNERTGRFVRWHDLDEVLCEQIAKSNGYLKPDAVHAYLLRGDRIYTSFNFYVRA